jgi:hypothetical protein
VGEGGAECDYMVTEMRTSVFENKAVTNVGNDYLCRVAVRVNRPDEDIAAVCTIGFSIENCNVCTLLTRTYAFSMLDSS